MEAHLLDRIERILDGKVRPLLREHDGDVAVQSFEEGVLKVSLTGRCSHCPSSNFTMEQLIEKELLEALPQVKRVVPVACVSDELLDFARALLRHSPEQ